MIRILKNLFQRNNVRRTMQPCTRPWVSCSNRFSVREADAPLLAAVDYKTDFISIFGPHPPAINNKYYNETCSESKDTSRVGRLGNFLCLLWQHCRRPWSFTCDPCSFGSGRTGFLWVRRVWNGSADPKSRQMRGAFRHMISQRKRSSGIYWTIRRTVRTSRPAISTCFFT
jgi:hypothetical protein